MMCDQVKHELVPFIQGELPVSSREQVSAHIALCPACAEEATVVKDLCGRVSRGLHAWVDTGDCPHDLETHLRLAVRHEASHTRSVRHGHWRAVATAAAAVAVGIVLVTATPMRSALVGLPVVGGLARLFGSDVTDTIGSGGERVVLSQSASASGVTVTVDAITYGADQTVVELTVSGAAGVTTDELESMRLLGNGLPVPLRKSPSVTPAGKVIRVTAGFASVPAGRSLDLHVPSLGGVQGEWTFRLPQRSL